MYHSSSKWVTRTLITISAFALSSVALAKSNIEIRKSNDRSQPNIIFLLADDQRSDVLGCYGNDLIQTPSIDRLAAEGIRFENAFCEVPICAASRATIFSGLSQRTHGYNFLELPVPQQYVQTTYPALLKSAGYRTGFAGKFGCTFGGANIREQFDFFKQIGRNPYLKKMPDGSLRHETDLCADAAIEFIKSNTAGQAFCMSVSFNASHAEDGDRRPGFHFQWPESSNGLYEDITIPEPRLADPKFNKALPPFLQEKKNLNTARYYWRWDTPEKYQTNMRAYYRMVTGIDHAIARILKTLKTEGLDENTIIIYAADNGLMLGDRGTAGKWNHYEQSLSIPLVIYDPRIPIEQRGRVVTELVTNLDLAPTFVDLAKENVPQVYQGHSLVPFLTDTPVVDWREDFLLQHKFQIFNNWNGVRSKRYKLAVYYDEPSGPYECLYDLEKDPDELVNLASNPEYANVHKQMMARLESYKNTYPLAPTEKSVKEK
ncbi:sulfatase family protein [Coraliomargarita sp. W4R53]